MICSSWTRVTPAYMNVVGQRVGPAGQRLGPVPHPGQVGQAVAQVDDGAVDVAGPHARRRGRRGRAASPRRGARSRRRSRPGAPRPGPGGSARSTPSVGSPNSSARAAHLDRRRLGRHRVGGHVEVDRAAEVGAGTPCTGPARQVAEQPVGPGQPGARRPGGRRASPRRGRAAGPGRPPRRARPSATSRWKTSSATAMASGLSPSHHAASPRRARSSVPSRSRAVRQPVVRRPPVTACVARPGPRRPTPSSPEQ